MEEIVKLIIPFLIFLFFIFRTLSQRKAKAQEESEVIGSSETEEENEVVNEKEMNRMNLKRWFTEEEKRANHIKKKASVQSNDRLRRPEKHTAYQAIDKRSTIKKHTTEEITSSTNSPLIRLRSKEDAKRAFLYAEIFNRKY